MTWTSQKYADSKTHRLIIEDTCKDPYRGSPLMAMKSLSSKKKGKFFEKIYEEYASEQGKKVSGPGNSDHDRIVDGRKKEIKGSFLWGTGTHFRWQQIRPEQDYEDIVFIAAYPDRIEFYEADKQTVASFVQQRNEKGEWIYNQHGGKKVNSGTFFLDGFPEDYEWMKNA
jgi:hypothetical protein